MRAVAAKGGHGLSGICVTLSEQFHPRVPVGKQVGVQQLVEMDKSSRALTLPLRWPRETPRFMFHIG